MAKTLLDKVWDAHSVRTLPSGQTQLLIGLHLIHEVTTPQAFQMLRDSKLKVRMPERTFGTLDHIIPTTDQTRPYADPLAEEMAVLDIISNGRVSYIAAIGYRPVEYEMYGVDFHSRGKIAEQKRLLTIGANPGNMEKGEIEVGIVWDFNALNYRNIVGKAFFVWMNFSNLRRIGPFE